MIWLSYTIVIIAAISVALWLGHWIMPYGGETRPFTLKNVTLALLQVFAVLIPVSVLASWIAA